MSHQSGVDPSSATARRDSGKLDKPSKNTSPTITILQFLVGALVTMGGSLFAILTVNSFGMSLGLVHLSIGITGLFGGVIYLQARPWSRNFLFAINALTVAYSTFSESVVQIQSLLPSSSSTGSLIGTIIAIIMSCAILVLLKRPVATPKSRWPA